MADKDKVHVDPVCGMEVSKDRAAGKARHEGNTYYFCSKDCKDRFELNPAEYALSFIPKS